MPFNKTLIDNIHLQLIDGSQAIIAAFLITKFIYNYEKNSSSQLTGILIFALIVPLLFYSVMALFSLDANSTDKSMIYSWLNWAGGNILGIVIFVPAIIAWNDIEFLKNTIKSSRQILELLLIIVGILLSTQIQLFPGNPFNSSLTLSIPFIVWALIRFELKGATLVNILVAFILFNKFKINVTGTMLNGLHEDIQSLQLFTFCFSVCIIILGAGIGKYKNTTEKLLKEKNLFEALMDEIPDSVYFKDSDSCFIKVNKAHAKILGLKNPGEVVGKTDFDFFPEEQAQCAFLTEQKVLQTGIHSINNVGLVENKQVGKIWMSTSTIPLKDKNEKIIGLIGISQNISELKSIEEALRKSEEKFRLVFEGTPVGIFQFDEKLIFTECNERFLQIFGRSKNEIIQTTAAKFFNKTLLKSLYDSLEGEETHYEGYPPLENGIKERWISMKITPLADDRGNVIGGIGIVEDITAAKKIKDELRYSESIYKSLVNQAKDGIFISGKDGNLEDVNEAGCEMLAYNKNEIIGKSINSIMKDDPDIRRSHSYSTSFYTEKNFIRKDGSLLPSEITSQVLDDGRFLVIVRDISERRNTLRQLQKTLDDLKTNKDKLEERSMELLLLSDQLSQSESELKELNASKDRFFSILAHDLKSPFSGLIGYSEILINDFDGMGKSEAKQYLKNLNKSIKNVYKLIENMLEWSRLQTGRMECNLTKIDLYESVIYSINLVIAGADNKRIKISHNLRPEIYITADEHMLNSLIENLLSNAIKFTPRGGSVELTYLPKGAYLELSIKDSGIGISKQNLSNIFSIDKNFSTLGTDNEKGTGLGLILCKEMIERQSGRIRVESELNKGSTFSFILPVWDNYPNSKINVQ